MGRSHAHHMSICYPATPFVPLCVIQCHTNRTITEIDETPTCNTSTNYHEYPSRGLFQRPPHIVPAIPVTGCDKLWVISQKLRDQTAVPAQGFAAFPPIRIRSRSRSISNLVATSFSPRRSACQSFCCVKQTTPAFCTHKRLSFNNRALLFFFFFPPCQFFRLNHPAVDRYIYIYIQLHPPPFPFSFFYLIF